MKKFITTAMLFYSIIAFAQVYVYNTTSLICEFETNPDSIVTIPLYRTPLPATNEGAIPAVFTVSQTRKVRFSKGNLQYVTSSGKWQFAEHQYDTLGGDISNPVIDQFGLGTSGWSGSNATAYMPTDTITDESAYAGSIGGSLDYSLAGYMAHRDWGIHNAISNGGNKPGLWRTPTQEEWSYLLSNRWTPYAIAIVNGVWGLVVLPDGWNEEPTLKLRPSYYNKNWKATTSLTEAEIKAILALCNNDTLSYNARVGLALTYGKSLDIAFYTFIPGYDYTIDEYGASATWADRPIEDYSMTPDEWKAYEAKGCVFLPFEKSRSHPSNLEKWYNNDEPILRSCSLFCQYWSSTSYTSMAMNYEFRENNSRPYWFTFRAANIWYPPYIGGCVRLVQDY